MAFPYPLFICGGVTDLLYATSAWEVSRVDLPLVFTFLGSKAGGDPSLLLWTCQGLFRP